MFSRSQTQLYQPLQPPLERRVKFPARALRFQLAAVGRFLVALGSLRQNKLRTGLTLIGIVVGVTAVIAVVTIIKGLDQTVAQTFSSQGSTVFTISKRPRVITSREDFIKFNKRKDITEDDAQAIFACAAVLARASRERCVSQAWNQSRRRCTPRHHLRRCLKSMP
jgi:ABC-type lipoprotein release transport system permease subunit